MQGFQAFIDGFSGKRLYPSTDIKDLWRISDEIKAKQEKKYKEILALKTIEIEKTFNERKTYGSNENRH